MPRNIALPALLGLLGLASAGCPQTEPLFCETQADCTDPALPYCDLTGEFAADGVRNQCIPDPFGDVDASVNTPDAMPMPDSMPDVDAMPGDPELSISSTTQDFGSVVEGQQSTLAMFTVTNVGESASGTLSVALSGANSADFTMGGNCDGMTLAPGDGCMVEARFAPQTAGAKAASLDVSAIPGGDVAVALSGTGLALGDLTMTPTTRDYSTVDVGSSSAAQSFTVENTGGSTSGTMSVTLTNTNDFTITADGCDGMTLGASATCQISVVFEPARAGSRVGSLQVTASPGGSVSASLGGTGRAGVTVNKNGTAPAGGTVTSSPAGISCGATCSADFTAETVTLTASVNADTIFVGWSGACSGAGSCQLTMTTDRTVTATFDSRCGNGTTDGTEECDDGRNGVADDGCEDNCTISPGVKQVVTGSAFTCALSHRGDVRCWGMSDYGQLGLGTTESQGDDPLEFPTANVPLGQPAVSIAAGGYSACAVLADDTFKCWGFNGYGNLGYGHGDNVGDGNRAIPSTGVGLGAPIEQIAMNDYQTCAVLEGGSVKCWGQNIWGGLGTLGDEPGEMPPPTLDMGGTVSELYAGFQHWCALMSNQTIRCWGANGYGSLGNESTSGIFTLPAPTVDVGGAVAAIGLGHYRTCVVLTNGNTRCFGYGQYGALGYGNTDNIGDAQGEMPPGNVSAGGTPVELALGSSHTCARFGNGSVRCWGYGSRLGYGSTAHIGDGAGEMPPGTVSLGGSALRLAARDSAHSCAILPAGKLRCWGSNSAGQLGLGNTDALGDNEVPSTVGALDVFP